MIDDEFQQEDFNAAFEAVQRNLTDEDGLRAALSNNINIIISALRAMSSCDGPWSVEINKAACVHCGEGGTFDVVSRDGVALSHVYGDEDDAMWMAEQLNHAFRMGRLATDAAALS